MMISPRSRYAYSDLVLALAVSWLAVSIYLSHHGAAIALSSDNVVPYVLFDDLFRRDLPLAGWQFPEAPFWLPDVPLAWLAYLTGGSLRGAVLLYACMSSALFVLLARTVLQRAGFAGAAWRIWLGLWLGCTAAGAGNAQGWFTWFQSPIHVPYNHSGAMLGLLAGTALLIGDPASARRARLGALALLTGVMLFSDRLFAVQFVLPALVLCVGMRWWKRSTWHGQAALLLALALIASEFLRWFLAEAGADPFGGDRNQRIATSAALAAMLRDTGTLFAREPVMSLCVLLALAATITLCLWPARAGPRPDALARVDDRRSLAVFVLLAALAPMAASVVLGRHISIEAFRYCQPLTLLGLPLAGLLASGIARFRLRSVERWLWWAVAVECVLLAVMVDRSRAALDLVEREQEQCLRAAAEREDLRLGAAGFWYAVELTARFPRGPVLIPLGGDAGPRMTMMTNLAWLGAFARKADELPTLDFVDEYGYTQDALDRTYGTVFERVTCPRSAYRIYRPQQGALAQLYRHAEWLPAQLLARLGRAVVPAAAWATDMRFAEGDSVHASGTFAEPTTVVANALEVPAGRLQLWIDYALRPSAPSASVRWEVVALDGQGNPRASLGDGQLEAALTSQRVELPLRVRGNDFSAIGIAIAVQGDADLHVRAIGVAVSRD
jgi:hypothetical protein